jgi:hypothetical protein
MSTIANNKKAITWVAESGLLVAMLVVVQLLSFLFVKVPLISQLFTGSLVNLVLIVGAGSVGFSGAAVAAVLSPVLAVLFGQMKFPVMIPVVIIGNVIIVAITWAFFIKDKKLSKSAGFGLDLAGVAVGAVAKTAFLWGATVWLIAPVFFVGNAAVSKNLSLMFSFPQLITAMIGGILALLVLPAIRAYRSHRV